MLQFVGLQTVRRDLAAEQQQLSGWEKMTEEADIMVSLGSKTISSCASQQLSADFSRISLAEFCHQPIPSQMLARVMELQDDLIYLQ